jgi:hypothetical protein
MNKLDLIVERYSDGEWLSADGFEDAILGITDIKNENKYSYIQYLNA